MNTQVYASLLAEAADAAAAKVAAATITTLSKQWSRLAGEDSGLGTRWLEFCAQIQGEHSIDWGSFQLHVRQVIEAHALSLTLVEQQALWLQTPGGEDWLDEGEGDRASPPIDIEEVVDDLYRRVCQIAGDFEDEGLERFLAGGGDDFEDSQADDDDDEEEPDRDAGA